VNAIHLFTFRGIPVFVSPMYFLLLVMFGYRDPAQGIIWAIAITLSLLVHEFGHALVARRLRHDPSIMLHGFGGLTSRSRRGRDVDEAAIVAMGPAAGLALGLLVFGLWSVVDSFLGSPPHVFIFLRALLYTCFVWNLLNLLPLWPLDGGQLMQLGLGRWLSPQLTARITHGVSLVMIVLLAVYAYSHGMIFSLVILLMLGLQNVQGIQGRGESEQAAAPRTSSLASELVSGAAADLEAGNYKEAARRAHQARAQEGVSPSTMEKIWEILGLATEKLGEHEEALAYLRRARPNERVRAATSRVLATLGRNDELATMEQRWSTTQRPAPMRGFLIGALAFIGVAILFLFTSSIPYILFG
jgi:stage IV sporulation protein FB